MRRHWRHTIRTCRLLGLLRAGRAAGEVAVSLAAVAPSVGRPLEVARGAAGFDPDACPATERGVSRCLPSGGWWLCARCAMAGSLGR